MKCENPKIKRSKINKVIENFQLVRSNYEKKISYRSFNNHFVTNYTVFKYAS